MELAFIGMGANMASPAGPPETTLLAAAQELASLGEVVCRSSLYSTQPVGFAHQPRFLNAVIGLHTNLAPRELLDSLLRIERRFGRDRSRALRNGPRPLDLDLLLFGDRQIHEPGLQIPHPRLHERLFVLVPLCEIAPGLLIVPLGQSVKELLEALPTGSPAQTDAILPFESPLWRPRPCGNSGLRADSPDPNRHG